MKCEGQFLEPFLDLCVSSLREGHANLLCIVPILTDVAEATYNQRFSWVHIDNSLENDHGYGLQLQP